MNYEYGILYFETKFKDWDQILSQINPNMLYYDKKNNINGYAFEPHLTLLFGLHDTLTKHIDNFVQHVDPFKIKLNGISSFENDEYDVLKIDVELNNTLKKYREIALTFPHTSKYSTYNPHITICYMQKGTSKLYTTPFDSKPIVKIDTMIYRDCDNKLHKYYL